MRRRRCRPGPRHPVRSTCTEFLNNSNRHKALALLRSTALQNWFASCVLCDTCMCDLQQPHNSLIGSGECCHLASETGNSVFSQTILFPCLFTAARLCPWQYFACCRNATKRLAAGACSKAAGNPSVCLQPCSRVVLYSGLQRCTRKFFVQQSVRRAAPLPVQLHMQYLQSSCSSATQRDYLYCSIALHAAACSTEPGACPPAFVQQSVSCEV